MSASIRSLCTRAVVALGLAMLAAPAFAQQVDVNYVPGTDFSKYHSYRWVPVDGAAPVDEITDAQVRQAVDQQLAAKGLAKADADPVDLYIGYQTAMQQQQQLNAFGGGVGWRFGGGMATVTTQTIDVGTLAIDVYDPAAKQLLWRGSVTETLHASSSPDKKQKELDKAMAKLLKDFPPRK